MKRDPNFYHHLALSFGMACGALATWVVSLMTPSLWIVPAILWVMFTLHLLGGE